MTTVIYSYDGIWFTDGQVQYGTPFNIKKNYKKNTPSSIVTPLASKYPTVIKNRNINYYTGDVSATFIKKSGCEADEEHTLKYNEEIIDFLTSGHPLLFKVMQNHMLLIWNVLCH